MSKNYAFVDRRCPQCNGRGHYPFDHWKTCPRCKGTGSVGSYEEVPDIRPKLNPTPFSKTIRATREARNVSMRTLALHIGISVRSLSEIERGFGDAPTPEEEKKIREWMEAR